MQKYIIYLLMWSHYYNSRSPRNSNHTLKCIKQYNIVVWLDPVFYDVLLLAPQTVT
jgi:hypothetical protein